MEDPVDDVTSQLLTAQMIMQKGKRGAAAYLSAECANGGHSQHLDAFMHLILNPSKRIDDSENIDWCKWLIAGGHTPAEFSAIGKRRFMFKSQESGYFHADFVHTISSMTSINLRCTSSNT